MLEDLLGATDWTDHPLFGTANLRQVLQDEVSFGLTAPREGMAEFGYFRVTSWETSACLVHADKALFVPEASQDRRRRSVSIAPSIIHDLSAAARA